VDGVLRAPATGKAKPLRSIVGRAARFDNV
jgi:hypothetical protein